MSGIFRAILIKSAPAFLLSACATGGAGNDPPLLEADDAAPVAALSDSAPPPQDQGESGAASSGGPSGASSGSGAGSSGDVAGSMCPMDVLHGLAALLAIGQPSCPTAGCDPTMCCYVNMSSSASVCVKK